MNTTAHPSAAPAAPPVHMPDAAQRREQALARLQNSRERLRAELLPAPNADAGGAPDLRHPLRYLRRWWQRNQPLDLLQDWLQARSRGEPLQGASPASAALLDAGVLALHESRRWIKAHPAASVAAAALLGGLALSQRRHLARGALALAAVASSRTRTWVLAWARNPLVYQVLYSLWTERARPAAGGSPPVSPIQSTP